MFCIKIFLGTVKRLIPPILVTTSLINPICASDLSQSNKLSIEERAWKALHLTPSEKTALNDLIALIRSVEPLKFDPNKNPVDAVINGLHPYADRNGTEGFNMSKKPWVLKLTNKAKQRFVNKTFNPILYRDRGIPITMVLPAGSVLSRDKRQDIARSLENIPKHQVITVTGERQLWTTELVWSAAHGQFLNESQRNEDFYWRSNKQSFAKSLNVRENTLVYLYSKIHEQFYPKTQKRATTFDNAYVLGQFLQAQHKRGQLPSNEPIVIVLEHPAAQRMHMVFRIILPYFIDNPIELHTGQYRYPEDQNIIESIWDNAFEKAINQVYMYAKGSQLIQNNVTPNLYDENNQQSQNKYKS